MLARIISPGLAAILAFAAAPALAQGDLTGVWTNASLTQLTRPPGVPLVVSEADARARSARYAAAVAADSKPTDPGKGALGEITTIGQGFNSFWNDAGEGYARVKGQFRSSWIVSPADGQLPLTEAGRALERAAAVTRNRQNPDGPEQLAPNDRCIIGSRGSGGPGMLNNLYNSNYQIVQTPDAVVIVVEMAHDARTIPIFPSKAAAQAGHGPAALQRWLGDSTAWWEGATLVVETVNVNPEQGQFGPILLSPRGRVTERLTRASDKQIFYAFQVEDPVYYTEAWRAEMSLNAIPGPVYEYACHEGNYAMRGILGARRGSGGAP